MKHIKIKYSWAGVLDNALQRKLYANVRCHNFKKGDEMQSMTD